MGIFDFYNKKEEPQEMKKKGQIIVKGVELEGFETFQGSGMLADDVLIDEGYASNADVYAIISRICEVSSDIPFVVESFNGEIWEEDEDSLLNEFINNPSDTLSEKELRFRTMLFLLSTGDFFFKKIEGGFELVRKVEILEPNLVDFNLDSMNEVKDILYNASTGKQIRFTPEEVLHGLFYNPSVEGIRGKRGISPLNSAYNSLQASNDRLTAMAHIYKNRGATNVISSGSDIILDEDEREELQKNTDKIIGGAKNFNKSIVTSANVNVTPLGMNANDLQLVNSAEILLRDICKAFNVPSVMFSDQSASTFDNVKVAEKLFYTNAIIPYNNKIVALYNKEIVPAYSKYEGKTLRIRQRTEDIEALQSVELDKANKNEVETRTILSVLQAQISDEEKQRLLTNLGYEI